MIGESNVIDVLEEIVVELGGDVSTSDGDASTSGDELNVERRSRYSMQEGDPVLTFTYCDAQSLKRDLNNLVDVRALMVELEQVPPLMQSIAIDIELDDGSRSVRLGGRAVHESHDGVAIELFASEDEKKRQLRRLVDGDEDRTSERGDTDRTEKSIPESSDAIAVVDRLVERPDEPATRWSLDDGDDIVDELLFEAAGIDGYGFLEFQCSDAVRHYVIHYGKLIDVRSDPVEDSEQLLIDKLKSSGHVTDDDVERAAVLATLHDIPRQDALVDMGCITLEELLDVIRDRLVDEFYRIWDLDADTARLYLLQHRPPLRLRRSSIDLAEQLARRIQVQMGRFSPTQLQQRAERFSGHRLSLVSDPSVTLTRFGFDAQRRRFLDVILDEPKTLSEIQRISNLRDRETIRFLLVIDELDLLEKTARDTRLFEHSEIEGLYERLDGADHFEVLGIHWSAYGDEVDNAYRDLRDTLDVPEAVEEKLGEKLHRLREAVSKAHAVLSDRLERRAYRDKLVDDFSQRSVLEVYEKKVDSHRMRGEGEKLVDCLHRILELNPGHEKARKLMEKLDH